MLTRKQTISFSSMVVGTPVTTHHALRDEVGTPLCPDVASLPNAAYYTVAATDKTLTVTRLTGGAASVNIVIENWTGGRKQAVQVRNLPTNDSDGDIAALQLVSHRSGSGTSGSHLVLGLTVASPVTGTGSSGSPLTTSVQVSEPVSGGTGATITTNPPTTLAHCIADLGDLLSATKTHFAAGSQ